MLMKTRIRRAAFTLLEMMVALAVLSVIGTVTAVQVKTMIDKYRFEAEVTGLFMTLQEAQVLSAAYQTDLALTIEMEKGQLVYRFSTDEPFASQLFLHKSVALPRTAAVQFKGVKANKHHFDIYSGGRVEPEGILSFHPVQENGTVLWLDLQRSPLLKCSYVQPPRFAQQIPTQPKRVKTENGGCS